MGVGKEIVFVDNIDYMAKLMAAGNSNRLTGVILDKNFQGLVIDKVCK